LIQSTDGPLLVYAIEVEDVEHAEPAYAAPTLPIDLEHKRVMPDVVASEARVEPLDEIWR
jgi:hypothetical protein